MKRFKSLAFPLLAAALLSIAAQAQPSSGGAAGSPSTNYGGPAGAPPDVGGVPQPVLAVTSIEVLRSDRAGGLDIVRVRGVVTSNAWSQPHLVPVTRGAPLDGILDLIFQASSPNSAQVLGPFMVVEAILPVESKHPYKGVRVRAGLNALTLKAIPGYAEASAPKEDCAKCLGKYFVAKGTNPPAGATAENTVRESDLPYALRIVKPSDGIAAYTYDPNRVTLLLSEDGRIIDAAWD